MSQKNSADPATRAEDSPESGVYLARMTITLMGQIFDMFRSSLRADDLRRAVGETALMNPSTRRLLTYLQDAPITDVGFAQDASFKSHEISIALTDVASSVKSLVAICNVDEHALAVGGTLHLDPQTRADVEHFLRNLRGLLPINPALGPEATVFSVDLADALERSTPHHPEAIIPVTLRETLLRALQLHAITDREAADAGAGKPSRLDPAVRSAASVLAEVALQPDFPAVMCRSPDGRSLDARPGKGAVLAIDDYHNDSVIQSCQWIRHVVGRYTEMLACSKDDGDNTLCTPALRSSIGSSVALFAPFLAREELDRLPVPSSPFP